MAKNTANYGNDSIRQLKDEERVRLRPAVIFGSDGLDGCAHAAFEILSNAVDEARQGYGKLIILTAFRDGSIQVEDNGRGCPLDWNPSEKRFNWELVFCELYAGGKYNNNQGGDYDFSLGTNGLGSCATQYASEYMDVTVWRDGNKYSLHFKKGKVVGAKKKALEIEPSDENRTGTTIKWRPDLEVFTSISSPHDWYRETMRRQAVVNANVTFRLRIEGDDGEFSEEDFCYPKGIEDYVLEKVGTDYLTEPFFIEADRRGRDRGRCARRTGLYRRRSQSIEDGAARHILGSVYSRDKASARGLARPYRYRRCRNRRRLAHDYRNSNRYLVSERALFLLRFPHRRGHICRASGLCYDEGNDRDRFGNKDRERLSCRQKGILHRHLCGAASA